MSDVFISYESKDRPYAQKLATALKKQGWSVFWDQQTLPGVKWRDHIHQQAETAKCIVVLWSKSSISSVWVKEEAQIGCQRNILVPVLLEEVDIPFGFSEFHTASLVDWGKDTKNKHLIGLLDAVSNKLSHVEKSSHPYTSLNVSGKTTASGTRDGFSSIRKLNKGVVWVIFMLATIFLGGGITYRISDSSPELSKKTPFEPMPMQSMHQAEFQSAPKELPDKKPTGNLLANGDFAHYYQPDWQSYQKNSALSHITYADQMLSLSYSGDGHGEKELSAHQTVSIATTNDLVFSTTIKVFDRNEIGYAIAKLSLLDDSKKELFHFTITPDFIYESDEKHELIVIPFDQKTIAKIEIGKRIKAQLSSDQISNIKYVSVSYEIWPPLQTRCRRCSINVFDSQLFYDME